MPAYNTQSPPPALFPFPPGNRFLVFNADTLVANESSQQVVLPTGPTAGQKGIRVEIDFSANPGNVEIYVQESSADKENGAAGYSLIATGDDLTQTGLIAGPNGASTRLAVDIIPVAGDFIDLYVKTAPSNNGITCTARISRIA